MFSLQRLLRLLVQPLDFGQGQLIRQDLGALHAKASATLDANPQQAIGPLLEITDQRLATYRRELPRSLTHFSAVDNADHTKALVLLHAAADHIQVTRFEYLQVEHAAGEQHG